MNISEFDEIIEQNDQTEARRAHLEALRELVGNVYPNKFERSQITGAEDAISNILSFEPVAAVAKEIKEHISTLGEGEKPAPELKEKLNAKLKEFDNVKVSGRLTTTPRTMGKAAFVHLSDGVNRLQIYVRRDDIKGVANDGKNSEVNGWDLFKLLDGGDFVGVGGFLFLTNTGELSVHVETIQFLSKALLPMPDKMHGIADPEIKRRFRYADLIASSLQVEHEGLTTREVFERRAKLISGMRRFLDDAGFIEVETPMLTPKATGAAAEPFETFHKALGITLYARIAPELYLKRLTVGGFEKVYELNRNFRNEGLSQKHNPEFTMLEFYCAYMDVNGMMDFAEAMIKESVQKATGGSLKVKITTPIDVYVPHEGDESMMKEFRYVQHSREIDFEFFKRISMKDAISDYIVKEYSFLEYNGKSFSLDWFNDYELTDLTWSFAQKMFHDLLPPKEFVTPEIRKKVDEASRKAWNDAVSEYPEKAGRFEKFHNDAGKASLIVEIFDLMIEKRLIQPTFIIDYPKSISPLSKASPENPNIAERFELFINGMECANGFSELNDPQEQYERFRDQMRERETGDEEAMVMDEDYIRALAYGMPPAAGIGIGIDRLVMLLTNKHSIRDVILFPHMRPERRDEERTDE
ncbi:MAG: lysine--tRNA ligase [Acidobacteriota bacterium]|nr:lysine--tRNA ligase [Acidobacteriota bacterium]